jgi:hypothetical protein
MVVFVPSLGMGAAVGPTRLPASPEALTRPLGEVESMPRGSGAPVLTLQGSGETEIVPDRGQGSDEMEIIP